MILHPGILALLAGSLLVAAMLVYSAWQGLRIVRHWDIRSGSERQLELERRTYLVSTLVGYGLGFHLLSLFLFVYTADSLSPLFVGAMCAAGSLNVNGFGYPTMLLKLVNFLLAGLWLILNTTDNRAHDYPLTRLKYTLLLMMAPFLALEAALQAAYLLSLAPDLITSCCGTLFTAEAETVIGELVAMPRRPAQAVFISGALITVALGMVFRRTGKGAAAFSLAALAMLPLSLTAIISFISVYIYELPTHHCPFCLLHREYHFIGYPMYAALLAATLCGLGVGLLSTLGRIASLREQLPAVQRRLALVSLLAYAVFLAIAGGAVWFSRLSLAAY
jgi:hypothetical protein